MSYIDGCIERSKECGMYDGTEPKVDSMAGSVPWVGKLHHARQLCDDWGCIRDDAGNRIMTIPLPTYDERILDNHRREKTDPTQEIIDYVLSKLNEPNDTHEPRSSKE